MEASVWDKEATTRVKAWSLEVSSTPTETTSSFIDDIVRPASGTSSKSNFIVTAESPL